MGREATNKDIITEIRKLPEKVEVVKRKALMEGDGNPKEPTDQQVVRLSAIGRLLKYTYMDSEEEKQRSGHRTGQWQEGSSAGKRRRRRKDKEKLVEEGTRTRLRLMFPGILLEA